MHKKIFDPKKFYREVEHFFNSNPLKIQDPTTFIAAATFIFKKLQQSFNLKNIYVFQKKENKYVNYFKLKKEKEDIVNSTYDFETIIKLEEKTYKNKVKKEIAAQENNLIFLILGKEKEFIFVIKTGKLGKYFDQLYYVLSSFKYFINQHLILSNLTGDLNKASEIQNSLIPDNIPEFSDFDIAAKFLPAEIVGGDVYDFIKMDDELLGITIADASGHGLPAALQARDAIIGLRMGIEKENKIWAVINKLNKVIFQTSMSSRFISLFYGELEKDGLLTYVNAGHCNPIYIHNNNVQELDIGGMVLGWTDQTFYRRGFLFIEQGGILILYTDGLTETKIKGNEEFGVERLVKLVQSNSDKSAQKILDIIISKISKLKINSFWEDDVTLIIIKRNKNKEK